MNSLINDEKILKKDEKLVLGDELPDIPCTSFPPILIFFFILTYFLMQHYNANKYSLVDLVNIRQKKNGISQFISKIKYYLCFRWMKRKR